VNCCLPLSGDENVALDCHTTIHVHRRAAGTERLYFEEHETQFLSVFKFHWVFWNLFGHTSFERIRDGFPDMWKWIERKTTKQKNGRKSTLRHVA
jgi:hypothetical protein